MVLWSMNSLIFCSSKIFIQILGVNSSLQNKKKKVHINICPKNPHILNIISLLASIKNVNSETHNKCLECLPFASAHPRTRRIIEFPTLQNTSNVFEAPVIR